MTHQQASIVIISYHTGQILWQTLDYALAQQNLKEVILVNNGNPENVIAKLKILANENPQFRLVDGHGNVGFAKGCNIGAKHATADYLLMLNPDCLLNENDMLKRMIAEMESRPEVWMASCRIMLPDGTIQVSNKRNILTPGILFAQGSGLWRLKNSKIFKPLNIIDNPADNEPCYIPATSGAFMLFRKDKYKAIGGFDEDYFFHVEDLDLCQEINSRGGKILYVPGVRPIHFKSSSEVSSIFVEKHKRNGFVRYFTKYKGKLYDNRLYWPTLLAVYMRYYSKLIFIQVNSRLGKLLKRKEQKLA